MSTGRTVGKFCKFQIEDTGGAMRDIPVNSFGSVGLTYSEVDVSSLQEAIISVLSGQGSFKTTISGPFDNRAAATASGTGARPALSGSHTVLSALAGGTTVKSFGIYIGIQGDWATGDPVFGAVDSIIVTSYTVDPAAGTYTAGIATAGNRVNDPAWGTAAITAS